MPENKFNIQGHEAIIVNPETKELLGKVSLVGDPVQPAEWINANGPLQGFVIVDGRKQLKKPWNYQEEVLLRTKVWQGTIKIITYPAEGEDHGYLDFTSDLVKLPEWSPESKTSLLTQRGFTFLQSIFGA